MNPNMIWKRVFERRILENWEFNIRSLCHHHLRGEISGSWKQLNSILSPVASSFVPLLCDEGQLATLSFFCINQSATVTQDAKRLH